MTLPEFKDSLAQQTVPDDLSPALKALWADGVGNWQAAHAFVQDDESKDTALVHAYLHRKEGDDANARYWYERAGATLPEVGLEAEWESVAEQLLARDAR